MSFVVGRGRYGRATYPTAIRSSQSALVKAGFDAVVAGGIHNTAAGFTGLIRRNAIDPLRVQLPAVTPGNILVVDASGLTAHIPNGVVTAQLLMPVVSFNGSTNYIPGTGFFWIDNAIQESSPPDSGGLAVPTGFRCYAAVVVPAGATIATVELAYTATSSFFVQGQGVAAPSIALSATELLASAVPQPGPFLLTPF